MTDTKTILLIGRSGRGKSTLANVVTNTDDFKESSGSASKTKKIQLGEFKENSIDYQIIDTPGIGDTKMSDNEVLDIIAEAVYLAKDGVGQVFFVIDGRFDQYEMATYDLLRTIIFDEDITKHTTVVRTRFEKFKKEKECKEDIELMIKEASEKRTEIEKSISTKEKELVALKEEVESSQLIVFDKLKSQSKFSDAKRKEREEKLELFFKNIPTNQDGFIKGLESIKKDLSKKLTEQEINNLWQVQNKLNSLQAEIEKAKKELVVTNLAEILESCQGKVVYVDSPSMNVAAADDEDENKREKREKLMNLNKKTRVKSREKLLRHLGENCQEESYNPPNLKKLSDEIKDDYSYYLNKKKELDEEMKRLSSRMNQASSGVFSSQTPIDQTELVAEEKQVSEENPTIIEKEKLDKMIAELQDKKERLKKEIAEKEKIIHQKVLKHIFNNYEAINKELGGDIFLNSVAGDYDWPEINPKFASKELVVKWLSQGFDYFQTQKWTVALIDFDPEYDADFCAWLRDKKQLTVEEIKRASYPQNIERLRSEYAIYLGREVEVLDEHSKQLLGREKDWKNIHEDFEKDSGKNYQQLWEENGLTYQDAQEWILIGFKPEDYHKVSKLKAREELLKDEVQVKDQTIKGLQTDLEQVNQQLTAKNEELEKLKAQNQEIKNSYNEERQIRKKIEEDLNATKSNLTKEQAAHQKTKKDKSVVEQERDNLKKEASEVKKEKEKLTAELEKNKEKIQELQKEISGVPETKAQQIQEFLPPKTGK